MSIDKESAVRNTPLWYWCYLVMRRCHCLPSSVFVSISESAIPSHIGGARRYGEKLWYSVMLPLFIVALVLCVPHHQHLVPACSAKCIYCVLFALHVISLRHWGKPHHHNHHHNNHHHQHRRHYIFTQNSFPLVGSESIMFTHWSIINVNYKSVLSPHLSLRGRSWIERRRGSRATWNLYSVGKIYIASAVLYCRGLCACFSGQAQH